MFFFWNTLCFPTYSVRERVGKNTMLSLNQLKIGKTAYVRSLSAADPMRRRLLDLGFVNGSEVRCLLESAAGDPRAYLVKNTVVALRNQDAASIEITEGDLP